MSIEQEMVVRLSPLGLGLACIVGPIALAVGCLVIVRKLVATPVLRDHHDVAGSIFGALGTIYGIFLAFVVATTWSYYDKTASSAVEEAHCLSALYSNAAAYSPEFRDQSRTLTREYRDALVNDEWKRLERGQGSPAAKDLLDKLSALYASYEPKRQGETAFFGESIHNLNMLKQLRSSRIDDASTGLIPLLWIVLITGACLTVSFTFLFGPHNFYAQCIMTIVLTAVISLTLYTIINLDFPFSGQVAIAPDSLKELLLE